MPTRASTFPTDQDVYNSVLATLKTIKHVATGWFADEGVTSVQLQALGLLETKGPMLMRKLSEAMAVTPANITGMVDRLEEKKLVQRKSDKGDRRTTIIEITPEGKTLQERLAARERDLIQKSLAHFTKEERIVLKKLLEKFQKGMSLSVGD